MQIFTIKLKPKQLLGITLALTGLIVIVISFVSNHNGKTADAPAQISCASDEERAAYLTSLGYRFKKDYEQKSVTVPQTFNDVYTEYNDILQQQGFDLEPYKGKQVTVYTYQITNYKKNKNVKADLMVADGVLIGADLCDPSAKDGFLIALEKNENTKT